MLRQTGQVAPDETIADLFGARAALALLRRAESGAATADELAEADWTLDARIAESLAQVGLPFPPDTPLAPLSGGERTRAALHGAIRTEARRLEKERGHTGRSWRSTYH